MKVIGITLALVIVTLFGIVLVAHGKSSSGITGTVTCNNNTTFRALINVQDSTGLITHYLTNHAGIYIATLAPGNYFIALESDNPCVIPVDLYTPITVNAGQYTVMNYAF